jgi:molybdate transport system permease protein
MIASNERRMTTDQPSTRQRQTRRPTDLRGVPKALLLVATAVLLLLVTLPLIAIAVRSAPTFWSALGAEGVSEAIRLTALTSGFALVVIVVLGTPAAWLIARRQIRGWKVIDAVLDLPVVLPPSVAGIGLLIAFGRNGLIGSFLNDLGIQLAFTTAAVVIAQIFVAAPLYIRAAVIGLRRIDEDMESVAMVEGANAWQIFRFITVPLSASALITGGVLAWTRALGEFGATILFAGNLVGRTQTMALAIYIEFQNNIDAALALALLLMLTSLTVLVAVRLLARIDQ